MRVYIVDWQQGAKSGTSVVKASGTTALRERLWMFQYARITEVESVAAWEWRGHRRKLDKVQASNRYIIGETAIVRRRVDDQEGRNTSDQQDGDKTHHQLHKVDTKDGRKMER